MEFLEVSAKNVDEAITKACIDLGRSSDQLEIQVISEGSTGFLGIGSKPAVIQVRIKEEENPVEEKRRYLSFFNWQRFMEECRRIEDPSLLDRELILESIAEGSFKKSKLKKAFLQWQHSGEE